VVGAGALVASGDLASGQRDAGEHAAHLPQAPARRGERCAHVLAALAGLGDLREHKLIRLIALEPAPGG
jgi:hypothetical protein